MSEINCFDNLPVFILYEVFFFLDVTEMCTLNTVSKKMSEQVSSDHVWGVFYSKRFNEGPAYLPSAKMLFKKRLFDPFVGDKLHVSWVGQFILATVGPYRGKAWWDAVVIEKDESKSTDNYHVRYEGWQNNWNEWVSRERLRWPITSNCQEIAIADRVELRIDGSSCKAYLECAVAERSGDLYTIKGAHLNQDLTVEKDRLRLMPLKPQLAAELTQ
jgi:hypothetical protein